MSAVRSLFKKSPLVAAGVLAMSLLASTAEVSAAPVLGGQLFWSGGDVTITVLPATAGYTSQLKLFSADPDLFIARNVDVGASLTIGASLIDVDHNIGDELVFGIFVENTGDTSALWSSHPTRPPGLATPPPLFFLASSFCEPIAPYTAAHDPTP